MKGFLMPQGPVNPDAVRTRGGKPIIKIPANFHRDFHKMCEDGVERAYTPVQQNLLLHNADLFKLQPYDRSPTGIFMPKDKR